MSRVVVSGSHDAGIPRHVVVKAIKDSGFEITELGCGMAKEVDTYGKDWAEQNGIPVKEFYAPWRVYGIYAGLMRNGAMAEWTAKLILVWNGTSDGSKDMRKKSVLRHRLIYEVVWFDGKVRYQGHLNESGGRI